MINITSTFSNVIFESDNEYLVKKILGKETEYCLRNLCLDIHLASSSFQAMEFSYTPRQANIHQSWIFILLV